MRSTTLRIGQIVRSPFNARTKLHTDEQIDALASSIRTEGLWHPIQVHPIEGDPDEYGAFAGDGRRQAIVRLVERGEWKVSDPVRVHIHDQLSDGALVIGSLVENDRRYDLRDYEKYAAIVRAHTLGQSIAEIAGGLGCNDLEVMRYLRIGELAPPVFEAFAQGRITLDQAQAYGATEDHDLQAAAFEALNPLADNHKKPADIRAWLKFNDPVSTRELLYVTEETYKAAGGHLEPDLFTDFRRVVHPALLRQLVDEKLAALRTDVRGRCDREVRFVAKPPQGDFGNDYVLEVTPAIDDAGRIKLPDGDIVAYIAITDEGGADVSWWYASKTAKFGPERLAGQKPRPTPAPGAVAAPARAPEPPASASDALTQDTIEIMRSMRRAILRAALIDDARQGHLPSAVAVDYLVFGQLRMVLHPTSRPVSIGLSKIPRVDGPEISRDLLQALPAMKQWSEALDELMRLPAMKLDDEVEAFLAYVGLPQSTKDLAAALVVGFALERSLNSEDYALPLHDTIAQLLGLNSDDALRAYWTPTGKLLDRLPTSQCLAIAEPMVERAIFGPWSRFKRADLTLQLLAVVTGAGVGVREAMRHTAATWVHPLLRFAAPGADEGADDASAELEGAE